MIYRGLEFLEKVQLISVANMSADSSSSGTIFGVSRATLYIYFICTVASIANFFQVNLGLQRLPSDLG